MQASLAWLLISLTLLGLAWVIPPQLGFFLALGSAALLPIPVYANSKNPSRSLLMVVAGFLSFYQPQTP